jgi:hypothetical protein
MTCAVVSAPVAMRGFIAGLLPCTVSAAGRDRIYFLYRVRQREADFAFTDPTDGGLLVECKFFNDMAAARAWVSADDACRSGQAVR